MKLSGANFPAVESLIRRKRTDVGTHRGETCLASDFFARVVQHTYYIMHNFCVFNVGGRLPSEEERRRNYCQLYCTSLFMEMLKTTGEVVLHGSSRG